MEAQTKSQTSHVAARQSSSVVICAYTEKRWDDITAAIESVRAQTLHPQETILVIDYNPAMLERVKREIPDVVAVANRYGRGLSGAKNTGFEAAKSDLVAFLDDDAIAEPQWLARLVETCSDPNALGVGGWVEPLWESGRPKWFPDEYLWAIGGTSKVMPKDVAPIRNVFGGNSCWRRDVYQSVGGFHTGMGAGTKLGGHSLACEETELCIRAHQRWPGKTFLFDPQAIIHHRVSSDRATWKYFRQRCFTEGLSKAIVARNVGAGDGLSAERTHVLKELPKGVIKGIVDTVKGDSSGLQRSFAIVLGLVCAGAGYLKAMTSMPKLTPVPQPIPSN